MSTPKLFIVLRYFNSYLSREGIAITYATLNRLPNEGTKYIDALLISKRGRRMRHGIPMGGCYESHGTMIKPPDQK